MSLTTTDKPGFSTGTVGLPHGFPCRLLPQVTTTIAHSKRPSTPHVTFLHKSNNCSTALPEGCFADFRKLRKSCKGRSSRTHWPDGPAMTPLRFCRGLRRPCTPRKRRALYPGFFRKASQDTPGFPDSPRFKHTGSAKRKSGIAGPSGHCVRDERICKIAELAENTLAVLRRSRPFFPKNWGEAYHASAGCWGGGGWGGGGWGHSHFAPTKRGNVPHKSASTKKDRHRCRCLSFCLFVEP